MMLSAIEQLFELTLNSVSCVLCGLGLISEENWSLPFKDREVGF